MTTPLDHEMFLEYVKTRDNKLKNKIALQNQKLVSFIVNKYYNRKIEHKELRDDLLQEGRIGLLSAIDGFKPELGFSFSTYATWWVKQSVNNFLLNQYPIIKVPSNIRAIQNKVLKKLRDENMFLKDLIEGNAAALDITEKMLRSVNASLKSKWISSLEEPIYSGDGGSEWTLQDLIVNPNEVSLENNSDHTTLKQCLVSCIRNLPEKERSVLLLRYDAIKCDKIGEQKNV